MIEKFRVWLDDERPAPPGWVLQTTARGVIELLETGLVSELDLDHDLGDGYFVGNGYDVLLWLEERVADGRVENPPEIRIHTANVSARVKMEQAAESIRRMQKL